MFLGLAFIAIVILFLLFCILTSGKRADQVIAKFDHDHIVAHRDKQTKIVPDADSEMEYYTSNKNKE
jgi:hypothetical protein